jgi:hypothetical protein
VQMPLPVFGKTDVYKREKSIQVNLMDFSRLQP